MSSRKRLLIDAIEGLAAEPAAQRERLDRLGFSGSDLVDELALDFDDIAVTKDDMLDRGELNEEEHQTIASIDDMLERMSGQENARLWTRDVLAIAPEWAEIRALARYALQLLKGAG